MSLTSIPFNFGRVFASIFAVSVAAALFGPPSAVVPVSAQATPEHVTFTKDVAPLLQRNCQVCHRPGAIAPMSLLTYEEVRPWVRAIKEKVQKRTMPPWTIDRTIGIQRFKGDRSLTDEDIATIVTWVDSGAPRDTWPRSSIDR